MADLLGADPGGIVFGRSMTQLTFDFSRTLAKTWRPGDEVVVTRLDHDANIRPWVLAAAGGRARSCAGRSSTPRPASCRSENVAAALSRADPAGGGDGGVQPDRHPAGRRRRSPRWRTTPGALLYVDGVHLTAHAPVDVAALGADFYACSPYKFLGPHCGVLAGRVDAAGASCGPTSWCRQRIVVPERFELGTLPYELLAGTTAAVDFLAGARAGIGR